MVITERHKEECLVEGIRNGDERSFRHLFDHYKDIVFSYALKLSGSRELAEEIVQEVFYKIWKDRERLDPSLSINGLIFRIARNHLFNLFRKAANDEKMRQQVFYSHCNFSNETEDTIIYSDILNYARQAISQLPPKRQRIFLMSRMEGMEHEEIARKLGISKNTVKDQIVKAGKSLREILALNADTTFLSILALFYIFFG